MARAIWSGSIGFGLVNVPVGLYSATQDKTVHFNQFQEGTDARVRNKRVNEKTGKESYYLAPSTDDATRPYGLLLQAMDKAGRIGIATLVMRGKQYPAAIRPHEKVLVLETMYFGDEVRDPADELPSIPRKASFSDKDLKTAISLIDSLTTDWKPANYTDTYRDRVLQLVQAKGKGREVVTDSGAEPEAEVLDLMEALRKSVEAAKSRRAGNKASASTLKTRKASDGEPKKRPAKKAAAKKAAPKKKPSAKKAPRKAPARKAS